MDEDQDIGDRGPARSAPRDSLFLLTNLRTLDGVPLGKARIRNLSATGLMADCERSVPAGIRVMLELRGIGAVIGTIAWVRGDKIGLAFDQDINPQLARKSVVAEVASPGLPDYLRVGSSRRR